MSKKTVKFHVKSDDYFGTIATILSLIQQTSGDIKKYSKVLKIVVNDLMFLQRDYKIIEKL